MSISTMAASPSGASLDCALIHSRFETLYPTPSFPLVKFVHFRFHCRPFHCNLFTSQGATKFGHAARAVINAFCCRRVNIERRIPTMASLKCEVSLCPWRFMQIQITRQQLARRQCLFASLKKFLSLSLRSKCRMESNYISAVLFVTRKIDLLKLGFINSIIL
jgi:hypothetical protein